MSEILFEFTPGNNTQSFPKPINGDYELKTLVIEANSIEELAKAVRKMRIYFRFDFGSPLHNFTKTYHLSNYIIGIDSLVYTIEFENEVIEITTKAKCTNAIASIQDDVIAPVTKMTLTLNHIEL